MFVFLRVHGVKVKYCHSIPINSHWFWCFVDHCRILKWKNMISRMLWFGSLWFVSHNRIVGPLLKTSITAHTALLMPLFKADKHTNSNSKFEMSFCWSTARPQLRTTRFWVSRNHTKNRYFVFGAPNSSKLLWRKIPILILLLVQLNYFWSTPRQVCD